MTVDFYPPLETLKLMKSNALLNCFPVHKALPVITLSKSYELLKEGEEFEVTCIITDVDSSVKASWISYKSVVSAFSHILYASVQYTNCECSCACLASLAWGQFGFAAFPKGHIRQSGEGSVTVLCPCGPSRSLSMARGIPSALASLHKQKLKFGSSM